jgi:S-adenosyl-L-methionine hydrolase (adenosine-forming)
VNPSRPVICFVSDYGLCDDFVGVCHGVIASICPAARVIDVTHGVARHDVRAGAVILREALPYLPAGVVLAVVDPGVGGLRRAVALRTAREHLLVGPDNGLLWPAAQEAGGIVEAVDIGRSRFRLEPTSATFHGRDIFAPVAARLAGGVDFADAGEPLDPERLVELELPTPSFADGALVAHALYIDRFGNVQLDARAEEFELAQRVMVQPGRRSEVEAAYVRTFGEVGEGELLLYEDSYRRLALAVRGGSAARRLGLAVDCEVRIRSSR